MYLMCVDDGGFEDQIENGSTYMVEESGVNGYRIYNDKEELEWYGEIHFGIIDETVKG
jgi:hypothetical protein